MIWAKMMIFKRGKYADREKGKNVDFDLGKNIYFTPCKMKIVKKPKV